MVHTLDRRTSLCYRYVVVLTPELSSDSAGQCVSCADASRSSCATHDLIMLIGDRWSVLVLIELGDHGETRSADLKRAVTGVSQKVLTSCLRRLEDRGFVARTVEATVPVSVSYQLTPLGRSFFDAFSGLREWADDHVSQFGHA